MFKVLLSLIFAVATLVVALPATAQDDANNCAAPADNSTIANVTMTDVCHSDYDCGYGNICEYGQCRAAQCWTSNQCFPWETCDQGRCQRDPWATTCQSDKDCFGAYYCYAGYCKHW